MKIAGESVIRYPSEVATGDLTQLLNCLFGNISLKPGVDWSASSCPDR